MASIFTKIITRELPAYIIAETDTCIAFLDVNPNALGHTLCVPKQEVDKITDLDEELYVDLMKFSKNMAIAIQEAIDCKRVGFSVIGLEVPHVHVHLIPLNTMADATFGTKVAPSKEVFETLVNKIKAAL